MGLERHRHDCVYKFYLSGGTGIDLWIGKLSCRSLGAFHFLFVSFPCYFIGYIEQSSSVRANGQELLWRMAATPCLAVTEPASL